MTFVSNNESTMEILCECDSVWAGCTITRKSTSGVIIYLLGAVAHFSSKTQSIQALSSGEAELYAMGSAASECLHVRNVLLEGQCCKQVNIYINTDSTAAKSIASGYGVPKRTRHIDIKYMKMRESEFVCSFFESG